MKNFYFSIALMMACTFHHSDASMADAAARGMMDEIKIKKWWGCDINAPLANDEYYRREYRGCTPLQIACGQRNVLLFDWLLLFPETDVNAYQTGTSHALHMALQGRSEYIVKRLIEYPSMNFKLVNSSVDLLGNTPLHAACEKKHAEAAQKLLEQGANIVKANSVGDCPIHVAAKNNNADIVDILLQRNAEQLNWKNSRKETPLICAAKEKCTETMKKLLSYPEIDVYAQDSLGETALIHSCKEGYSDEVALLLAKSAQGIDTKRNDGKNALDIAMNPWYGSPTMYLPIIELLIKHGANSLMKSTDGDTALAKCFDREQIAQLDPKVVQKMVMAIDSDGNSPMHVYAVSEKASDEFVHFLVVKGLSVGVQNKQCKTAPVIAFELYQAAQIFHRYWNNKNTLAMAKRQWAMMYSFLPYCFLPVATGHTVCQVYKDIFERFGVIKEIQHIIMEYYYRQSCAEIVAGKPKGKIA